MTTVGENVRFHRKRLGFNQRTLAALSDLTQQTISGVESGRRSPHPQTVKKLAWGLGDVTLAQLYEGVDTPHEEEQERWEQSDEALRSLVQQIEDGLDDPDNGNVRLYVTALMALGPGREDRLDPDGQKRFWNVVDRATEKGMETLRLGAAVRGEEMEEDLDKSPT